MSLARRGPALEYIICENNHAKNLRELQDAMNLAEKDLVLKAISNPPESKPMVVATEKYLTAVTDVVNFPKSGCQVPKD